MMIVMAATMMPMVTMMFPVMARFNRFIIFNGFSSSSRSRRTLRQKRCEVQRHHKQN